MSELILGGEQLKWTVTLDGDGAGTLSIVQEGILFSMRVIPRAANGTVSGTPTLTARNGNDILVNARQFAADTTAYPQAATEDNEGTATGLYMPFLLVGATTLTVTGGAANGSVDVILKLYP